MNKQKMVSGINNSFTVLGSIIFLVALAFGLASGMVQTVFGQEPGKVSVTVGGRKCNKLKKPVNPNVIIIVRSPTIVKATFNPATEEFCVEGVSEGASFVTFTGTYRQVDNNNNNGGLIGGVPQNDEQFTLDWDVKVETKVENPPTNVSGDPSERGKIVQIFYTSLREYDAQKADRILRERGYVPDKKLTEDGEGTQAQKKKLYCNLPSGGTEAGVRQIAELVKNIESVTTECLEDRPHTFPEYVLWIVSEKPFTAELEDYQKEIREALDIFHKRFGYEPRNNIIKKTYIEEFEKEGIGDWDENAHPWSENFWRKHVERSNSPFNLIYHRPLEILRLSIHNIKTKNYSPTPEEVSHFRGQMTDWLTRKDELTRRLNEIIVLSAQENSDRYANRRLKTLSDENRKIRESERLESRKRIWEEIDEIKGRPVFAYILGGVRNP